MEIASIVMAIPLMRVQVLEWCPKNNPMRIVLGSLKQNESSQDLRVYPVRVAADGVISAKFTR